MPRSLRLLSLSPVLRVSNAQRAMASQRCHEFRDSVRAGMEPPPGLTKMQEMAWKKKQKRKMG